MRGQDLRDRFLELSQFFIRDCLPTSFLDALFQRATLIHGCCRDDTFFVRARLEMSEFAFADLNLRHAAAPSLEIFCRDRLQHVRLRVVPALGGPREGTQSSSPFLAFHEIAWLPGQ